MAAAVTVAALVVAAVLLVLGAGASVAAVIFSVRLRRVLRYHTIALKHIGEQVSSARLDARLVEIVQQLRDLIKTLEGAFRVSAFEPFRAGSGSPSDIVLGSLDTYEQLDQNWGSIRDPSGRHETGCAIDGDRKRTAVIVVVGQSNAANHGAGRYAANRRVDNFNVYDGRCYRAADPLLGASGDGGNFATRLGDKLIDAGLFDRVILAPIAMGGTTVEQWAEEGMFNRRIPVLIRRLFDAGLSADFILWQQGEGNPGMGDVDGRQYRKNLLEVIRTFRRFGVTAPFFVSLTTLCGGPHANADNIRAGQRGAVNSLAGIYQGPDTDTIGVEHRWDTCHFDEAGLDMAAALWLRVIADFQRSVPPAHAAASR